MRAPSVEVRDAIGEDPTQVTLTEDDCVNRAKFFGGSLV